MLNRHRRQAALIVAPATGRVRRAALVCLSVLALAGCA